jgi:hypothetical protein
MFANVKRLVEVHNKHTVRQDFVMNFEVWIKHFFSFLLILLCKLTYEIPNLVVFIFIIIIIIHGLFD